MPKESPKTAFDLYKDALELGLAPFVLRHKQAGTIYSLSKGAFYPTKNFMYFFRDECEPHDVPFEPKDLSELEIVSRMPEKPKRSNLAALRKQSRTKRTMRYSSFIAHNKDSGREE